MLCELRVENLLLIERAELGLGPGLNVLTGETGAGKTVLAHALDLLLCEVAPHASALGCAAELADLRRLAANPGYDRQRTLAALPEGLEGVLRAMHGDFVAAYAVPA